MYPYAIIGNCQIAALISKNASIDWCCLPRPDSPPVFGKLLDENGGYFSIFSSTAIDTEQRYIENTNVVETLFIDKQGNSFLVIDFAPRFEQFGRMYRPTMLIRIIRIISGSPQINVCCKPVNGWAKNLMSLRRGNSHIKFVGLEDELRLTTNFPLTYLIDEVPTTLLQPMYFALTWGQPVEDDLAIVCETFLQKTVNYWRHWVKHCTIPSEFQKETIRSALTLKLHCYEDTGAILASITCSLPEEFGGVRNWDYRYCWLRDACFTVSAFYRLGHFEELEGLLRFILGILQRETDMALRPVYRIDGTLPLPETEVENWTGCDSSRPVRVGNQAAEHVQNDVYGEILLIIAPLYFDERFSYLREEKYATVFARLARRAYHSLTEKDAGLWEHRNGWKLHSFTFLVSWAGLDRYHKLLYLKKIKGDIEQIGDWRDAAFSAVCSAAHDGVVFNSPDEQSPDASLFLLATLRFPNAEILEKTVNKIYSLLGVSEDNETEATFIFRYKRGDDFGQPKHAFVICTYWLIEALVKIGKIDEARRIFAKSLLAANHVGLLSEHFDVANAKQTGNFPQCYSHVGLINAAFAVSADWDQIL